MKLFKCFLLIAATAMLTSAGTAVNTYTLSKGYTVSIHGTSNLHDWDENVVTVTGDGSVDWNGDASFDLDALNIKMDVHSIKSTEGSMMDKNTYKALKADDHPEITFALITPVKAILVGSHTIAAKINLTIAGVTKAIDMSVTSVAAAHGNIAFEGTKTIKMTDYGVKPPVALLGTMRTGDDITIHFKTVFSLTK
jgi:polyisoprenoid-binding protein YceI